MRRSFIVALMSMGTPFFYQERDVTDNYKNYLDKPWNVPLKMKLEIFISEFDRTLSSMLEAVSMWVIPPSSKVIIRLNDGEHIQKKTININNVSQGRLSIIGNQSQPEKCCLLWDSPYDAFYIGSGMVLGEIDGLLMAHAKPKLRGLGSAFLADEGGVIRCGPNIKVKDFYYGFQARYGGVIRCDYSEVRNGGDANYFAFNGGHISARNSKSYGARDGKKGLGSGYVAEYGGTINAESAVAEYNALAGFSALSNGVIRAYHSKARHNGGAGYFASTGGAIVAHDAIAQFNCGEGVLSVDRNVSITGNNIENSSNKADKKQCLINADGR